MTMSKIIGATGMNGGKLRWSQVQFAEAHKS